MKMAFFYFLFLTIMSPQKIMAQGKTDYIKLSQDLLYAAKTGEPADQLEKNLATATVDELSAQLKTDAERKAFWLNIYNAYTHISLQKNPDAYKKRNKFFTGKFIHIAGNNISPDLVEHAILRKSKAKYSLGYFNKLFKTKFEKQFRVDKLDYRIHFALNCGARSCPPIAFYKPDQIDSQLNLAAKAYLKNEVIFNMKELTVSVPAILSWFRRDFGGKKGILKLLHEQKLVPEDISPRIHWKKYNWELHLQNFEP